MFCGLHGKQGMSAVLSVPNTSCGELGYWQQLFPKKYFIKRQYAGVQQQKICLPRLRQDQSITTRNDVCCPITCVLQAPLTKPRQLLKHGTDFGDNLRKYIDAYGVIFSNVICRRQYASSLKAMLKERIFSRKLCLHSVCKHFFTELYDCKPASGMQNVLSL